MCESRTRIDKGERQMKIIFLTENTVEEYMGGAQMNTRSLVEVGRERGHVVEEMTRANMNKDELLTADLVVLVKIKQFKDEDLEWVMDNCKFIKSEMDYEFCEFGNCECFGEVDMIAGCGKCNSESRRIRLFNKLFDKAEYFSFFTPGQREMFRNFFGEKVDKSILQLQFYGDADKFHNMGLQRIHNSVFWVGRFSKSKGLDKVLAMAIKSPHINFFFCGKAATPQDTNRIIQLINNIGNCTYLGCIKYEDLPHYYNLMETFVYEGYWPDTGPATVIEAMLCGCNISANKRLATILSNNFTSEEDLRTRIAEAKPAFWKKLEEVLK